jgi:hypothetical protein
MLIMHLEKKKKQAIAEILIETQFIGSTLIKLSSYYNVVIRKNGQNISR